MTETEPPDLDGAIRCPPTHNNGHEVVRQFLRFCVVGASSTIVDFGVFYLLTQRAGLFWVFAQIISFSLAVSNGFIWNSIWTFKGIGNAPRHHQYLKFVAVNAIGLVLNLVLIKAGVAVLTGSWRHSGNPPRVPLLTAKLVAVICVSVWNYVGSRKWTFR